MQFFNLYGLPVIVILFIVWMIFRNIDKKYKPPTDSVNRGLKGFEQIGGFAVIFSYGVRIRNTGRWIFVRYNENLLDCVNGIFAVAAYFKLHNVLPQQKPYIAYADGNFSKRDFYSYRFA